MADDNISHIQSLLAEISRDMALFLRKIQNESGRVTLNPDSPSKLEGFDPNFSKELAQLLTVKAIEMELKIQSLPEKLQSKEEQISQIETLIDENAKAQTELDLMKERGKQVQEQLCDRLKSLTDSIYNE